MPHVLVYCTCLALFRKRALRPALTAFIREVCYPALMEDSRHTAKRRQREEKTLSQMIVIYCEGHHPRGSRTEQAYCGERLCPECLALDEYAVARTKGCRRMDEKTSCEECGNHCYKPSMRQSVREVMRYAGPRMVTRHPIAAIRHLLKR